jgi:DNA-binding NtrC family response regulator
MMVLDWFGTPPPNGLIRALRDDGFDVKRSQTLDGEGPLIVATRLAQVPNAVPNRSWMWVTGGRISPDARTAAVLRGAYDAISLTDPQAAETLARRSRELLVARPSVPATDAIVTVSPRSRRVLEQVAQVAATSMPVLLTGETGTGKEVIARLIHAWSSRHDRRFVPINCAAIPNDLMEAELFGYARGAFSGAVQGYDGQVMAAEGGTVFLD